MKFSFTKKYHFSCQKCGSCCNQFSYSLTKNELVFIKEKIKDARAQFPKMRSKDPVSIILGARSGDIVRFKQDSKTRARYEITEKGINVLDYFSSAEELRDVLVI